MKSRKLFILLLLPLLVFGVFSSKETVAPLTLLSNSGETAWTLIETEDDTSAVFDMYNVGSIQYAMFDTTGTANDSINYSITLLTSLSNTSTVDSTFATAQAVTAGVTSSGWQAIVAFSGGLAKKGVIVATGITGNTKVTPNILYVKIIRLKR